MIGTVLNLGARGILGTSISLWGIFTIQNTIMVKIGSQVGMMVGLVGSGMIIASGPILLCVGFTGYDYLALKMALGGIGTNIFGWML